MNTEIRTEQLLPPDTRTWVVMALVGLMFVTVIGVLVLVAMYRKASENKERRTRFRRRSIQFLAVGLALPAILILALDGVFTKDVVATLFGAFFGYVLSGIGEEERDG
jgi:nitrogen fixation/metabolism regulation signal transduction histidine kinase